MSKFKVGNKVRLISTYNTEAAYGYDCNDMLEVGEAATIKEIIDGDTIILEKRRHFYHPDDFELAEEWLTPGEALDAHLEDKALVDEDGFVWECSRTPSVHNFINSKFKIKPKWETKKLQIDILDETLHANEHTLEIFDYDITKEDALKIADFIIETYRKEGNNPVWQSTKTAPKDGTRILGYFKDIGQVIVFHNGQKGDPWEVLWDSATISEEYLLYWMPLPKPPKGDNRND